MRLSESRRESSHKTYGRITIISEDNYGGLVDFGEKVADDKSELDPMIIYQLKTTVNNHTMVSKISDIILLK